MSIARNFALAIVSLGVAGPACYAPDGAEFRVDEASFAVTVPTNLWADATATTIGVTAEWSNKVDLGDINGDGKVDIAFANGGNYASAGPLEKTRIFLNQGPGKAFKDATGDVFGAADPGNHARAVRIVDVNHDQIQDIFIANAYGIQSRLFLGTGGGAFTEVTATHLPADPRSFGDAQFGDVDNDGDLDIVLPDWGPGKATTNSGGPIVLWLGDGTGHFTAAPAAAMPTKKLRMSWSISLIDVDNDYDLDLAASCKLCTGSSLYKNDGHGNFTDASSVLPQFTNNYDFQPIDVNGDGFFDLTTINDGAGVTAAHLFINDGAGKFADKTSELWPAAENVPGDDNINVVLDYNSDGCPDFVTGALAGPDRLNLNDCSGHFFAATDVFSGNDTPGTLGLQMADLNGDNRLDAVMSQGEVTADDAVFLATSNLPVDSRGPVLSMLEAVTSAPGVQVRARIHDNKTPVKPFDFKSVNLVWKSNDGVSHTQAMTWYGESLWTARVAGAPVGGALSYKICAKDAAGNESCAN